MRSTDQLLSSVDVSWKKFSAAWKNARDKGSEKSVHDLRVSTRRLIAMLELTRSVSRDEKIQNVQRRFKKVLKRMGPLRDIQVQLENLSKMRSIDTLKDFKRALKRREKNGIDGISKDLKSGRLKRLSKELASVRAEFDDFHDVLDDTAVDEAIDRLVSLRLEEFSKARQRFTESDEEALHEMRIALKKLRYVVEAAGPLLGDGAKKRAEQMHSVQQLLGDTRDIQILKTRIEKWSSKQDKKTRDSIVRVLSRLDRSREKLMTAIPKAAASVDSPVPTVKPKPSKETVQAAVRPIAEASRAASRPEEIRLKS